MPSPAPAPEAAPPRACALSAAEQGHPAGAWHPPLLGRSGRGSSAWLPRVRDPWRQRGAGRRLEASDPRPTARRRLPPGLRRRSGCRRQCLAPERRGGGESAVAAAAAPPAPLPLRARRRHEDLDLGARFRVSAARGRREGGSRAGLGEGGRSSSSGRRLRGLRRRWAVCHSPALPGRLGAAALLRPPRLARLRWPSPCASLPPWGAARRLWGRSAGGCSPATGTRAPPLPPAGRAACGVTAVGWGGSRRACGSRLQTEPGGVPARRGSSCGVGRLTGYLCAVLACGVQGWPKHWVASCCRGSRAPKRLCWKIIRRQYLSEERNNLMNYSSAAETGKNCNLSASCHRENILITL